MINFKLLLALVFTFLSISVFSQSEDTDNEIVSQKDTWITPVIADEMTINPEQTRQWRQGQNKFPSRPKDTWELGIHGGHFFIDGDVDRKLPAGYGTGISFRKAINYIASLRFDFFYGRAKGLEPQPWRHRNSGGGLVENTFNGYGNGSAEDRYWFPSHDTRYVYGAMQCVFNLTNILFHKERNKWNSYLAIGAGLDNHKTMLDLLDGNGQPYTDLVSRSGFTPELFNSRSGRSEIKSNLEAIYDGTFETEGFKKAGIFRLGDKTNIHVVFTASAGFSRKISKRLNIGLEHQIMASDNDYLDGIKFRTAGDQTNNVDIGHYTSIRLGINMGNFSKRTEPLYWLNPMSTLYGDMAVVKSRGAIDLTDSDNDGVIDMLDQQADSEEGCLVDTRGITLDSDGDGIADCKDIEPYSPPGHSISEDGAALISESEKGLTEADVVRIIESTCEGCHNQALSQTTTPDGRTVYGTSGNTTNGNTVISTCGNWFLPMVHFDLDKYRIKPESYSAMHQVADVLKKCPTMCITVHGHTDARNTNDYNRVLSYKRAKEVIDYLSLNYGIDRSRFKLMYGGEESPLIPNLPDHHFTSKEQEVMQFMNRRVEFRVCTPTDYEMATPAGPAAGSSSGGSSRPGSKYSGNKNSKY
ncbi:MAG: OmpA family protein [Saprospiraceae bacterium]